jgi:hypothetical protein
MKKMFFFLLLGVLLMGSSFSVFAMDKEKADDVVEVHHGNEWPGILNGQLQNYDSDEESNGTDSEQEEKPYVDRRPRARLFFARGKSVDLVLLEPNVDEYNDIVGKIYLNNEDNVKRMRGMGCIVASEEEYQKQVAEAATFRHGYGVGRKEGYAEAISHQTFCQTHSKKIIAGAMVVTAAVVAPVAYYFGSKNK